MSPVRIGVTWMAGQRVRRVNDHGDGIHAGMVLVGRRRHVAKPEHTGGSVGLDPLGRQRHLDLHGAAVRLACHHDLLARRHRRRGGHAPRSLHQRAGQRRAEPRVRRRIGADAQQRLVDSAQPAATARRDRVGVADAREYVEGDAEEAEHQRRKRDQRSWRRLAPCPAGVDLARRRREKSINSLPPAEQRNAASAGTAIAPLAGPQLPWLRQRLKRCVSLIVPRPGILPLATLPRVRYEFDLVRYRDY